MSTDILCAIAMTRAEFTAAPILPKHVAWMACHFSAGGDGLSNLPEALPDESILMVDDRFLPSRHDPQKIADQLKAVLPRDSRVLLDLQRQDLLENRQLAKYLTQALPCSVCVAAPYAKDLDCPVLLPPPTLYQSLETYLKPWAGRDIWLEAIPERQVITVTGKGATVHNEAFSPLKGGFDDDRLCCRYQIQVLEDRAIVTLVRDRDMLKALLKKGAALGVSRAIGLYQQLGHSL